MFRASGVVFYLGLLAGCTTTGSPPAGGGGVAAAPTRDGLPALPGGARLIGLDGGALEGLLGRPTLVRSERQAQYWRYGLGECQLDLFLYAEPAGSLSRVIYLDVRPSGYASSSEAAMCSDLAALLRGEPVAPRRIEPEGGQLPVTEAS